MIVWRPELVDVLVAHGVPPTHAEGSTRKQMEEGDLFRFKGPRTPNRASYGPKDGAIVLFGLSGAGPSEGHTAYANFLPVEVKQTSGNVVSDPIGRLLPDMLVKNPEHDTEDPIGAVPFLTTFLTNIAALSDEDARNLKRSPEARSVRLELSTDPAFMVFRWKSEGVEHFAQFEDPSPLSDIFGGSPPPFQRTTTFLFPLLFAVAWLFAGVASRSETTASPSDIGNPAGLSEDASAPENENAASPGREAASTRDQSEKPNRGRQHLGT